jgi:carbon monoxide dehydrogenase subunit G
MLMNLAQSLSLPASRQETWKLLRDTPRLALLIPGVESITAADGPGEKYVARVVEKVGPFRLALNLEICVLEAQEPTLLAAELKGIDGGGNNRIAGTLRAQLEEAPRQTGAGQPGTLLNFDASVEVLGRLASLGAAPIRRRANELFAEFASRVQRQFVTQGR